jgi:hypothetical protein
MSLQAIRARLGQRLKEWKGKKQMYEELGVEVKRIKDKLVPESMRHMTSEEAQAVSVCPSPPQPDIAMPATYLHPPA